MSYTNPLKTGALARVLAGITLARMPAPAKPKREPKPTRCWRINSVVFRAHTRSEARAQAKRHFDLDWLPPGMVIEEVPAEALAA